MLQKSKTSVLLSIMNWNLNVIQERMNELTHTEMF